MKFSLLSVFDLSTRISSVKTASCGHFCRWDSIFAIWLRLHIYKTAKKYFTSHALDYSLQKKINNYRKGEKKVSEGWHLKLEGNLKKKFLMVLKGQINFENLNIETAI